MKRRVLVVEDNVLLALDLAEELSRAGLEVLGPATNVARALDTIEVNGCDVAVLDVHLGDELSTPVAQNLRSRGIPFVVLTGYSSEQLSPDFGSAPVMSKPARVEELVAKLKRCIEDNA